MNLRVILISLVGFISSVYVTSCNHFEQGERIYQVKCGNCHGIDGEGLEAMYPPLNHSEVIQYGNSLLCIITQGLKGVRVVNRQKYEGSMPPVTDLNEVELSNLINFIQNKWVKEKRQPANPGLIIKWKNNCNSNQ